MIVFQRVLTGVAFFCLSASGWSEGVSIRVDAAGFGASPADIGKVCQSAADELTAGWKVQASVKVLVVRGKHGPITAFKKNDRGEWVVRLDTGGNHWSQYAYQFAHELCHVLCKCENDYKANQWFEETLCEMASLYCMRRMSETWRTSPPYPNWRSYAPSLAKYVRDATRKHTMYPELIKSGLPAFYRKHRARLEAESCDRAINGAMAVVLLGFFECDPGQWEAIQWLNSTPSPQGESFRDYLKKWRDAVPEAHRAFIEGIAGLYGVKL